MLVSDDSGAGKEVVFHRADVKPHVPVVQPGSRGAGPPWPVAAPILLLCSHSQPRAAQRGHWAGLHSSQQQACYAHGSLARAARDGGSKTEPRPRRLPLALQTPTCIKLQANQTQPYAPTASGSASAPCAGRGEPRAGGRCWG